MNRWILAVVIMVTYSSIALGGEASPGTITVFGSAEINIEPDQVLWRLELISRDKDIDKAVETIENTRSEVMTALEELAVADSSITLGPVKLRIQHQFEDSGFTARIAYFEQSQNINVLQMNIKEYDQFRLMLTKIAGLSIHQEFLSSSTETAVEDVRQQAMVGAKRKAEALAEALGQKVGRAISISEFKPNPTQRDLEDALSAQRGVVDSRGQPEGIRVTYRVYGVFELQ